METEKVKRPGSKDQRKNKTPKHNSPKSRRKRKNKNSQRKLRKVFVDGISRETTEKMIYNYFVAFGPIEEVAKLQHRSDPQKYYAFVVYETINATRLATANPCPVIGKDVAYCALAAIGERYSGYEYFRKIKMLDEKKQQKTEKKGSKPTKLRSANPRRSSESHSCSAGAPTEESSIPHGLSLFGMGASNSFAKNRRERSVSTPQVYARKHLGLGQLRVDVNEGKISTRHTRTDSAGSIRSVSFSPTYTPSTPSHGVSPHFMYTSPLPYAWTPGAKVYHPSYINKGPVTPNYTPGGGISVPRSYNRHHRSQSYTRILTPPTAPLRLNNVTPTSSVHERKNFGAYLPQM